MKQLVINGTLQSKLAKVKKPVELVNAKGHRLGTFTPEPLCPWDPSMTPDDVDRIANEPGACTLEEIWKRLGVK
jgi:hypothetical protein